MGRIRQALRQADAKRTGKSYSILFYHPLMKRTRRCMLGADGDEITNLEKLNDIFLNSENWYELPAGTPNCIRVAWGVVAPDDDDVVTEELKRDGVDPEEFTETTAAIEAGDDEEKIALEAENQRLRRMVEKVLGRKVRSGPCPTLEQAKAAYLAAFTGRDGDTEGAVKSILSRFVLRFGAETKVDALAGAEAQIDAWLCGLKASRGHRIGRLITAGYRHKMRIYIIAMLEAAGLTINEKLLPPVGIDEVDRDRGMIQWLTRQQALGLAKCLAQPWRDYFLFQINTGLRPDELITLAAENFVDGYSILTLAQLEHLTLKVGPRSIQLPPDVQKIARRRLNGQKAVALGRRQGRKLRSGCVKRSERLDGLVFPDDRSGVIWHNAASYNKRFNAALQAAKVKHNATAGARNYIHVRVGCRTGRSTFGSWRLREGWKLAELAAYMGTSEKILRRHYAAILSAEVRPAARVLRLA